MTTINISEQTASSELEPSRGWLIALGIGLLVLGIVAAAHLLLATVASVYYVGILMLAGGIAQIVQLFRSQGWDRLYWLLGGLVYGAAGVAVFVNPLLASTMLTLVLALALVLTGVLRIVLGFQARSDSGWGWIVAGGGVTVLAGVLVLVGWPLNSLLVLGMVLAIDLLVQGASVLAFGLALRR